VRIGGTVNALMRIIPRREWKRYLEGDDLPFGKDFADNCRDDWHQLKRGVDLATIALRGIEINRREFAAAVALVLPAVAKMEIFDQADKLAIHDGSLFSYNDEISIRHALPQLIGIEGALDGRRLFQLLNRMPADTIKLNVIENELRLLTPDGNAQASLEITPIVLPLSEIETGTKRFNLPDGFAENLKLIAAVCARDMSRPVLTCVHIGGGWMEGSDGYRVARVRCSGLPKMLLPVTSAEVIARFQIVRLVTGVRNQWVHFETNHGTTISSRVGVGKYPDMSRVYSFTGTTFTLPNTLADVLERAQLFAVRDHRIDHEISVELRPRRLVVSAQATNDQGRFQETVPWPDNKRLASRFNIHPDFLRLALQQGSRCQLGSAQIKFVGPDWEYVIGLRNR
jgi:hypothetical protein